MKEFLSVLIILSSCVLAIAGPWDTIGKEERERIRRERQLQKLEQEASGDPSRADQQPNKVKALLDRADSLLREGSTKEQMDKAKSMLLEALRMAEQYDNPRGISAACFKIGIIYMWRSDFDKSLQYNKRALREAKRAGNCALIAGSTKNIGNVYKMRGENDEAARWLLEAMRISEGCPDKTMMTWTLRDLGQICAHQGKYDEALKHFQKGLGFSKEIRRPEIEGYLLQEIGNVYTTLGQYPEAVNYLERALATGEQARKPRVQQESLSSLGAVYLSWGKYQQAVDYFQKVFDRARRYGEKRAESEALLSQGEVYLKWGRYSEALVCLEKALKTAQDTQIAGQEAKILTQKGILFRSRGQYSNALQYLEQALSKYNEMDNPRGKANALGNIGLAYQMSGQYDKALSCFEQTLEICQQIGLPLGPIVFNISNLYLDLGQTEKAESVIRLSKNYAVLGRMSLIKREYPAAKRYYENLLASAQENRHADNLFIACTGLGAASEGMDDLPTAAKFYRKAVDHTEELRSSIDPNGRETFFDVRIAGFSRMAPYEGLARVLIKMNQPIEAFKESEYTRARIFAETLSKRGERTGFDVPGDVLAKDSALANQLAALSKNLQKAYEKRDTEAAASLEPQVQEAKENLASYVDMLRKQYPLYAGTRHPQPMGLAETALQGNEWVLAYHVTDPGLIVYVARGKELIKALFKAIPRTEIDDLVRKFREPLEMNADDDIMHKLKSFDFPAGNKLFDLLLGEVLLTIPKDSPVIIVPDDALGMIPFEMLPLGRGGQIIADKKIPTASGADFLGDRNPISYYQSVTALTLARMYAKQSNVKSKLLVFADPVFQMTDARAKATEKPSHLAAEDTKVYVNLMAALKGEASLGSHIARLPETSTLTQNLAQMYGANSECHTGLQASKDKFLKQVAPGLASYDKIVFATHGYFGRDMPGIMEPVLILTLVPPGTDGYLRMSEVTGLQMNADIVALTACQTGLGKKLSGEGTMGMGRAFQYAGAKCVLTSLWSVDQKASVNLVENFFRHVKGGKTKLAALKLARKEVREQGYDHPFFWAPFILVGEAR